MQHRDLKFGGDFWGRKRVLWLEGVKDRHVGNGKEVWGFLIRGTWETHRVREECTEGPGPELASGGQAAEPPT